jgi:hypothetical protein
MTPTILVAFGALVAASLVGALLAPSDYSPRQTFLRSQWQPIRTGSVAPHAALQSTPERLSSASPTTVRAGLSQPVPVHMTSFHGRHDCITAVASISTSAAGSTSCNTPITDMVGKCLPMMRR